MDTPVALIDPTPLLKELEQLVEGAMSLARTHENYAQRYAYDALVKDHVMNNDEARKREVHAAQCAFTHDGLSRGYDTTVYYLTTLQKQLLRLMAEAKASAEVQLDSTS